jgi:hypothetical protein
MMATRLQTIGIKQILRFEWMQKTVGLMLSGMKSKQIRSSLREIISKHQVYSAKQEISEQSREFAVNNLMKIWVTPSKELIPLRDDLLNFIRLNPAESLPAHWFMVSAAYPFWFNVAKHVGRLLKLQDEITQLQIINRLKEQYGDRQTISRYGRFVIRSFVDWHVLSDSNSNGCYEQTATFTIKNHTLCNLLAESSLFASGEEKISLNSLISNPSFFPFSIPNITVNLISNNKRIVIIQHDIDNILLSL